MGLNRGLKAVLRWFKVLWRQCQIIRYFIQELSLNLVRVVRMLRPYYVSVIFLGVIAWRTVRSRRSMAPNSIDDRPKEILVIRLDAIGDLLMSTLVFRELKQRFPNSTVTAVVQQHGRAILETNPYADKVLSPPRIHKIRILHRFRQDLAVSKLYWKHLRKQRFDIVLNPRLGPDHYSADILLKLVDCPQSFKYEDDSMKGLAALLKRIAFRDMTNLTKPFARHEVLSNVAITEHLTGSTCVSRPEIFLTEQDIADGRKNLMTAPPNAEIICVAFGAQAMKRAWPLERWAKVIHILSQRRDIFVLLLCSKAEEAVGRKLEAMLNVDRRLLSGASLRQVAATIKGCHLFMGPDSGLAHLAAVVDCPTVVVSPHPLNGDPDHGNSPIRFGPFSNRARVIQPENGVSPCISGCDALEPHCILQLTAEQVAAVCEELLDSEKIQAQATGASIHSPIELRVTGR
jgi:ADP-heptose:LPS heptosyltransferase